jgi:hypothetical protein
MPNFNPTSHIESKYQKWKPEIQKILERMEKEAVGYPSLVEGDAVRFHFPPAIKESYAKINTRNSTPIGSRYTQEQEKALEESKSEGTIPSGTLKLRPSSNIQMAVYFPERQYLLVSFKSGSTYEYKKVDIDVITLWESASSAGSFFHYNIRTSFKFKKVG